MFQHTAARRRLRDVYGKLKEKDGVSTHSRPKAAAPRKRRGWSVLSGFNTQPPEGGCKEDLKKFLKDLVSTHSRPKAAAS